MTSQSRILIDTGEQIECSNILTNFYQLNNIWYYRIHGQLVRAQEPIEVEMKPTTEWSYQPMKKLTDNGIYSKTEVESYHKVVFQPLNLPVETNNFINRMRVNEISSPHLSITRAFSVGDFEKLRKELQTSIWDTLKGTATNIGDITSFLIGIFFIFKIVKFIANTIINGMIIGYAFGACNYRIFFSCWDHMISLFLHKENLTHLKKSRNPTAPEVTLSMSHIQINEEKELNNLSIYPKV